MRKRKEQEKFWWDNCHGTGHTLWQILKGQHRRCERCNPTRR